MPTGFISSYLLGKLVATRPKIAKKGHLLIAKSGWRTHLFSLGAASRKVVVDTHTKFVGLQTRSFWFVMRSRRIDFRRIREVLYCHNDLSPESVIPMSTYQEDEIYTVALKLDSGEEVRLFTFFGFGDWVNNSILPDWCYWQDQLEAKVGEGNQEGDALAFAEVLSGLIGVPIGQPAW